MPTMISGFLTMRAVRKKPKAYVYRGESRFGSGDLVSFHEVALSRPEQRDIEVQPLSAVRQGVQMTKRSKNS